MKRRLRKSDRQRLGKRGLGFSLLELTAAMTITATLMASSMVVIRSSYAAWQAHEGDLVKSEAAHAVLRHIVRGIRQSTGVVSISEASNTMGKLELMDAAGANQFWEHTGGSDGAVVYGSSSAILAKQIDELSFTGYKADGVTTTTEPSEVQLVRCTVKVTLPRGGGQTRTVSCCGWIRSW